MPPTTGSDPAMSEHIAWLDLQARLELGAQFVGTSGFTTELGLAAMIYEDGAKRSTATTWPVLHVGYLF
jgi:hypothetical protein